MGTRTNLLILLIALACLAIGYRWTSGATASVAPPVYPVAPAPVTVDLDTAHPAVPADRTEHHEPLQVSPEYRGIPWHERPFYHRHHQVRHQQVFQDPAIHKRLEGPSDRETTLAHAAGGDPIAMFYLGRQLMHSEPMQALDYLYNAALGGTVVALPTSARILTDLADDESQPEEVRQAMASEAQARVIASLMFGYGIHISHAMDIGSRFPDTRSRAACRAAASLVSEINQHRQARGLDGLPLMFNESEITELMQIRGICTPG